jgi:formylglycine-generating enzyme required for sulfatase activity
MIRFMVALTISALLLSGCLERQESGFSNASQEKSFPKEIKGPLGIEFVLIPAGSFLMGCNNTDTLCSENNQPEHKVTISKAFYMSKYEITQAQWQKILDVDLSKFEGSEHPVNNMHWISVLLFLDTLNNALGTYKYRLPTEAEWEYAARAGTTTRYWFGDNEVGLDEVAWHRNNSSQTTHPVGQKNPNPWGLYDMYGNVAEWVNDWGGKYPGNADQIDPRGTANIPIVAASHVFRGGSWKSDPAKMTSYTRNDNLSIEECEEIERSPEIGFRIAFTPDESDLR